ncbi:unnamed protein product [Moneuplotes crassus]|uniref:Uncharacterized protein n=1 Tax=Euplotes crassus TaxID=5936 RepID=A0AAD1XDN0_EUPCR|nr:unnamed protein product [Moneuplotes crassus]
MDNLNGDKTFHQDLGTIKEYEVDSCNYSAFPENERALDIDQDEVRSHRQDDLPFESSKNVIRRSPYGCQVVPQNLFGSRTYTSPASFDSSSIYSNPFKSDLNKSKAYKAPARKFTTQRSNSIVTKLRSEKESEKFYMLRNVVENIDDIQKRKILLDFLDQTTMKTEYVTIKESSSSDEEVKCKQKNGSQNKRRHKSPISVMQKRSFPRRRGNNVCSEERKRFSLFHPRLKSVAAPEQLHIHNYAIERKNISDELDSKNEEKCYTEASKEVPLEAILERIHNYQNPFRNRRCETPSGYSASRDEPNRIEIIEQDIDNIYETNLQTDLEEGKKHRRNKIIHLPDDILDTKTPSVEMNAIPMITKYIKKFRTALIILFFVAILALVGRNIYLEVKVKTYSDRVFVMERQISDQAECTTLSCVQKFREPHESYSN